MKKVFLIAVSLFTLQAFAQDNFTVFPQKPQAGEEISFQYTQGGELSGIMKMPEAYALQFSPNGNKIIDIPLKREYGKLVGKIKTDTAATLLAFAFTIDDKFDKNNDEGFWVPLYDGENLRRGSYASVGSFYMQYGPNYFGIKSGPEKAVTYYEKEFEADSSAKTRYLDRYLYTRRAIDKEKGNAAIQAEIEHLLKAGLKAKEDYTRLASLYSLAGLRQQNAFINRLQKEKFSGEDDVSPMGFYDKFYGPSSYEQKQEVLNAMIAVADTAANKSEYKSYINYFQRFLLNTYFNDKNWDAYKSLASTITDKSFLAAQYNSTAWQMQEKGDSLQYAESLASFAVNYAKTQWQKPTEAKPDMMTAKQWEESRKSNYAAYADTYAMILYRLGQAKKGLPYAKDAAFTIGKGGNTDYNNTYALLAEKVLSPAKLVPELEKFVKNGKASDKIKEILKGQYVKRKKSDEGFEQYIAALEKEAHLKMIADLKTQILDKPAPQFTLTDLDGKKVSLADYKGKVVIVDFWATWCGPCIASFPGMKKMQEKYKDNSDVKFLFVDTWQREENKEQNAKDFITKNNYDIFHVLMDNEDKVVKDYEVSGIPTKFIIGKDGRIKFQAVGFDGEDHLYKELPAMIELAN
ncbi:MAG TPA: TlpA disulfide reductase family protein [Niabella sp.]|nr:TlpA disulfide reductase family protein [Niabella sp.]